MTKELPSPSDFQIVRLEEAEEELGTLISCGEMTGQDIPDDLLEQLSNNNPSVPDCVFDIEQSQEIAELYYDMFGY